MGDSKTKKAERAGSPLATIITIILVIYLLTRLAGVFFNQVVTVTATKVTINESFTATGWFIRNEVLVDGTSSETVKHIARSGEKVRKNSPLAVVYSDSKALATSQEIEQLNSEINLLKSAVQSAGSLSDTSKLDQLIASQLQTISAQAHDGIVAGIQSDTASLRDLCLRRGAGSLNADELNTQITRLSEQYETLSSQISGRNTAIYSPASGYFSEIVDGYEQLLTYESIETMTTDQIDKLEDEPLKRAAESRLGKVICGFKWYFVISVPSGQVENIKKGETLRLRFSQISEDIAVAVHDLRESENGEKTLMILEGSQVSPELVSMRTQSVEVIQSSYTGVKVPKSAIRMQTDSNGDPQQGVYILTGSVSRFKPIDPIYEGDTYYVVRQGRTIETTGVVVGDNIITKARGLEDMKVIK